MKVPMKKSPNILLITSDQHRGDSYGFENSIIYTPHLDQLAKSGTRFSACITPNLVCQPARASMLTGLLPLTHGVVDNGIDLPPAVGEQGFAGQLGRAGYRTGFIGKAHFSTLHTFAPTGSPECKVSSANYPADWCGPYMGFEHVELVVEGHNNWLPMKPPQGQHYERWFYADGLGDRKNALYRERRPPLTDAVQTWNSALPVAWHNSTWVGDQAIRWLDRHADQPFCMWASFPDPHHPFDAPEPWSRLHHPDEIRLPHHRELDLERRPWWHKASHNRPPGPGAEKILGNYLQYPPQSDDQLRAIMANYYGMISLIDHNVGRILASLEALGVADNTYVVFTSDHGEWLGDHGLLFKGPMAYEGLLRVGLIVRGPQVPPNKVVDEPVSTLDLAPTFSDWAGVPSAVLQHGSSLRPLIETAQASRDFALSEWDLGPARIGVPLRLRTVRTKTHKLSLEIDSGAGELYCLSDDPQEMENRFDDPGFAAVRRQLLDMISSRPADTLVSPLPRAGMA